MVHVIYIFVLKSQGSGQGNMHVISGGGLMNISAKVQVRTIGSSSFNRKYTVVGEPSD